MNSELSKKKQTTCAFNDCPSHALSPDLRQIAGFGTFLRKSDSKRITRWRCHHCHRTFSSATFSECFGQKKRSLNHDIQQMLVSGMSQRRISIVLHISKTTVERKFIFLAEQARLRNELTLSEMIQSGAVFESLDFDEMESFERSKCLPLSIPMVVVTKLRKILGIRVCSMPAKGPLAEISRKKYGFRKDDRPETIRKLLKRLAPVVNPHTIIRSDLNPHYPGALRECFGEFTHKAYKGRRGCVVGQGELKAGGFDPLFSLNHSAAMIRANVNRMVRRTWCTTKRMDRLELHLELYVDYHNRVLTA